MGQFRSQSPIIPYKEPIKNGAIPTPIALQKGVVGDRAALRIYVDRKIVATRQSETVKIWDDLEGEFGPETLHAFGGQSLFEAQNQRETCLTKVVGNLFTKLGFEHEIEPCLANKTPDLLVTRKDLGWFIELKAFFGSFICGEPEIAQAMEYTRISKNECAEGKLQQFKVPPKVMLITTGRLVSRRDVAFRKRGNAKNHVRSRYFGMIKRLSKSKTLDDRNAMGMYRGAVKKFEKKKFNPEAHIYWLYKWEEFMDFLENPDKTDGLLIPERSFRQILHHNDLHDENQYFNRIRNTPLEHLIADKSLLDF